MSGVLPTDKCKEEFAKLREKRAYKYITFKIDADAGVTDVAHCHEKTVRLKRPAGAVLTMRSPSESERPRGRAPRGRGSQPWRHLSSTLASPEPRS